MRALLAVLLPTLLFLGACGAPDPTRVATVEAVPESSSVAPTGAASPIDERKNLLLREMMRGLDYADGRVAIDDANQRRAIAPGDVEAAGVRALEAIDLAERNQTLLAISAFTDAITAAPGEAIPYVGLARALAAHGRTVEAEAALRTALDLEPGLIPARESLAELLAGDGRRDEAIGEWSRLLELVPGRAQIHSRLAAALFYAGDLATADRHAERAAALGAPVAPQLRLLIDSTRRGDAPPRARQSPPLTGAGPGVGAQVRVDVGGGVEAANETSAAGIDLGEEEVVTTWNDWRRSGAFELINMGVGVSIDSGRSWVDGLIRPPLAAQSDVEGDPMTAVDPRTGNLWVGAISFFPGDGLYVARKEPGSAQFEPSVLVGQLFSADKCWMAAGEGPGMPDSTLLYIAYNEGLWRSADLGDNWEFTVSMPFGIGFLPRVGPDGELYISYWDFGNGMKLLRSFDGGQTTEPAITIATRMDVWGTQDGSRFPGNFRVPPMGSLAVDPSDGELFFVYPDTTDTAGGNSNVDVYFSRSNDQGLSWTVPTILNGDADPAGDQFFPWIEVDDSGRLHVVYHDSRHVVQDDAAFGDPDGFFDAYYAYSDDRGQSWTEFRLTPSSFNSKDDGLDRFNQFLGDYNGLAVAGDAVYPTYLSNQNGDSDTFVNRITRTSFGPLTLSDPVPGIAGQDNTFTVTGAEPARDVRLAGSFDNGSTPFPGCTGQSFSLDNPKPIGLATADNGGVATVTVFVPGSASGRTVEFQAGHPSQCTVSNRVTFSFP